MTWLTENPWPLIVVLGGVATAFVSLWSRQREAKFLAGTVFLIACMIGAYVIDQLVVTPREQVMASVQGIVAAFHRGNADETKGYISKRAWILAMAVDAGLARVELGDDLRLSDLRVNLVAQNSRAVAKFRVNATVSLKDTDLKQHQPTQWESTWQQEENEWRLIKLQELNPITGETMISVEQYLGMRF